MDILFINYNEKLCFLCSLLSEQSSIGKCWPWIIRRRKIVERCRVESFPLILSSMKHALHTGSRRINLFSARRWYLCNWRASNEACSSCYLSVLKIIFTSWMSRFHFFIQLILTMKINELSESNSITLWNSTSRCLKNQLSSYPECSRKNVFEFEEQFLTCIVSCR